MGYKRNRDVESMNRILLVENCSDTYQTVLSSIANVAQLCWTKTISEAKQELRQKEFRLVLLETSLPDGDGIEFCSEIQSFHPLVPVIFLSSSSNLTDKVLSFSAGADDYITKPFHPLELRARLEAKIRKKIQLAQVADIYNWKELQIIKSRQQVITYHEGVEKKLILTHLEYRLLLYFSARAGEVISRDQILTDIWGEEVYVSHRSVDTHVSKLRRKLDNVSEIIQSIHGSGYKFIPTNEKFKFNSTERELS